MRANIDVDTAVRRHAGIAHTPRGLADDVDCGAVALDAAGAIPVHAGTGGAVGTLTLA